LGGWFAEEQIGQLRHLNALLAFGAVEDREEELSQSPLLVVGELELETAIDCP
jgi:hypothetical protein